MALEEWRPLFLEEFVKYTGQKNLEYLRAAKNPRHACWSLFLAIFNFIISYARTNLKRGIRNAKEAYKKKVEDNNSRLVWHKIQSITYYENNKPCTAPADASLREELNDFFALFEVNRLNTNTLLLVIPDTYPSTLREHESRWVLQSVIARKTTDSDIVTLG